MTEKVELTPELLRELQLKQLDMLVYFRHRLIGTIHNTI